MSLRLLTTIIVSSMGLYACGFETTEENSFTEKSATKVDKTTENSDDATASTTAKSGGETSSATTATCSAIALHGFHLGCDDDDIAAQEALKTTPTDGDKAEVVVEKPIGTPIETPVIVPPVDTNIVVFRIKAGTGNGGWNNQNDIINAEIGQTIRVFNDDNVIHRLHTGNNAPCPHGINIPVGGSKDCVVGKAFDSNTSNGVYDHIAGTSAKIWIKAK